MSDTIYSYTNDQAVEDGLFGDLTPDSLKSSSIRWLVSSSVLSLQHGRVYENVLQDVSELFNECVIAYNDKREINPLEAKLNGTLVWLFIEDEGAKQTFKVILPSDY